MSAWSVACESRAMARKVNAKCVVFPVDSWPAKSMIQEFPMTSCLVRYASLESLGSISEAFTRGAASVRRLFLLVARRFTHQIHCTLSCTHTTSKLLGLVLG